MLQNWNNYMATDNDNNLICMGIVADAHGIRGSIKIRSYTEILDDIQKYGPFLDENGKELFSVKIVGHTTKGLLICNVEGVKDRNQAEELKGLELYIKRELLPQEDEDEFYHVDLMGLSVIDKDGKNIGSVTTIHNFGAGDILEFKSIDNRLEVIQFSLAEVPNVDIKNKKITLSRTYEEILDLRRSSASKK